MRACSIFRRDTPGEYWVGVRVSFMSALSSIGPPAYGCRPPYPGWWTLSTLLLCRGIGRSAAQMHQVEQQRRLPGAAPRRPDRRVPELARFGGADAVVLREA